MDAADNGHYFDTSPNVASRRRSVPLVLADLTVNLVADRGVFSADGVDPGTRYLLAEAPGPTDAMQNVADLGCGYGPIAVTLALRCPTALVWAIDVNERALELCRHNAASLGIDNRIRVHSPDTVPDDVMFDGIWSNPPIRIGKAALHELLTRWLERLTPNGHAYLVVQRHLGSDSLQRWLSGEGWRTERLGSRSGYRILDVSRPDAREQADPSGEHE